MGRLEDPSIPSELGLLSLNINYLLLGLYGWEYLQTLHVERALIRGRSTFHSSLIPYILGRICLLIHLIVVVAATSPYSKGIDCLPGTWTITLLAHVALGCSSMNYLIRTWVIWKDSRLVHVLLLLLGLGQWVFLVVDVGNSRLRKINGLCAVHFKYPQLKAMTLIYTIILDLLVLVSSIVWLSSQRHETPLKKRLRTQGIFYFAVAGIIYIPPMVSALLSNIAVYLLVFNAAITVSTIVSSRAVSSLRALDPHDSGKESDSSIALTTQIGVQGTVF